MSMSGHTSEYEVRHTARNVFISVCAMVNVSMVIYLGGSKIITSTSKPTADNDLSAVPGVTYGADFMFGVYVEGLTTVTGPEALGMNPYLRETNECPPFELNSPLAPFQFGQSDCGWIHNAVTCLWIGSVMMLAMLITFPSIMYATTQKAMADGGSGHIYRTLYAWFAITAAAFAVGGWSVLIDANQDVHVSTVTTDDVASNPLWEPAGSHDDNYMGCAIAGLTASVLYLLMNLVFAVLPTVFNDGDVSSRLMEKLKFSS